MGRRVSGDMPQVRLHKRSGNGRVNVGGREVYVGRYGSPEARERYLELMVEHDYLPATAIPAAKPVKAVPAPLPAGNVEVPAGPTAGHGGRRPVDRLFFQTVWIEASALPIDHDKGVGIVRLTVRDRESIQEAVRRFRNLAERSGIKKEMRKREFFEKPSETRLRGECRTKRNRLLGV